MKPQGKNLLEISQLEKSFGGVTAISGLSFNVPKDIVYSVIGPNGAGKTTLFNMLCGFYIPDHGSIHLNSTQSGLLPLSLQTMATHQIAQRGISRTFQNLQVFYNMSVLENVLVGCHLQSSSGFLSALFRLPSVQKEEQKVRQNAYQALEFCKLEKLANEHDDSLSYFDLKSL